MSLDYDDTEWIFDECNTKKEEMMHVVMIHITLWNFDYLMLLQSKHLLAIKDYELIKK